MNVLDPGGDNGEVWKGWPMALTRRSLLRRGAAGLLAICCLNWRYARAEIGGLFDMILGENLESGAERGSPSGDEITLGVSAAFSGPSRGLGRELYRGAKAYFDHVNENGLLGRRIALKLYDDGYQPDPCVRNTMKLMLEDRVFLLFGYVGTPTVTRVLPLLKKFQNERVYLFFLYRRPATKGTALWRFCFQFAGLLSAGDQRSGEEFRSGGEKAHCRILSGRRLRPERMGGRQGGPTGARRRICR